MILSGFLGGVTTKPWLALMVKLWLICNFVSFQRGPGGGFVGGSLWKWLG